MKRESNIELLRFIAMTMVLLVHCNYFSIGRVLPEDIVSEPLGSFVKAFAEQACIICVNLFILISGWFGIRPSIKGIASFLYQILFYHILISAIVYTTDDTVPFKLFFSFIFNEEYWFIPSYLVLYAISPILNSFIENSSRKQHTLVLCGYFTLEFIFGWVRDAEGFSQGYSALSFAGLYLTAGYLRKHQGWWTRISANKSLLLYLLFTLTPVALYFLTKHFMQMISYCSPFVIAASIFFFLTFQKRKFSSAFVNSLGISAFSIFLIHMHPAISSHYQSTMHQAHELLGGTLYMAACIIFALCFGLLCVALDKLRILTWKPINEKIKVFEQKFHTNL